MVDSAGRSPDANLGLTLLWRGAKNRGNLTVNRRKQFSLLVVRGDGVRVLRFNFPKTFAVGVFVVAVAGASVMGALLSDWLSLRQLTREAVTFQQQITEQRVTIDTFNKRAAELRGEIAGWRELHAKIWEPFGPELAPGGRDRGKGIGGGWTRPDRPATPVQPSEELNRLAESVMVEGESLKALERLVTRAGKALASLPSRWPVRGPVNSEFGSRVSPGTNRSEFHSGMDIRAERGTPVRAPAAGVVAYAGTQPEYGTTIIIDHGQDIRSLYGHLAQISVSAGHRVERGALVGYTGNTGRSSGPHLHYEILVRNQPVNPRAYLWD